MKAAKTPPPTAKSNGRAFPLLLAVVLAILFCKSFLPDYVHFSNDGPLGEINADKGKMPGAFTGSWDDLNDIGTSGGAASPDISTLISWVLGPVGYSKFFQPMTLFILGLGAWTFFRQLKLSPLAAALGALATALNSAYVGNACWGTASVQIAEGMIFFALALVMANSSETRRLIRWTRLALAGMAVGMSVMEGADNGAIFSMFVAAYMIYQAIVGRITWTKTEHIIVWILFNLALFAALSLVLILHIGSGILLPVLLLIGAIIWNCLMAAPYLSAKRLGHGVAHVAFIAIFALFIAAQTVFALVDTYIIGAAGVGGSNNGQTSQQHWDWATEWSLPKKETLAVFVPGLFGYRMDTPKNMMDSLQDSYKGGQYWGGMGRDPNIDRFFDSGAPGPAPSGLMRFGYAGYYCGILVALVALFAMLQSLRQNSIFPQIQRHFIWFWTAVLIVALLLSWGRFAPFYQFLYMLPYFSTIRNPAKFMAIFYLAMVIIFAYGIDALNRRYLLAANNKSNSKLLANLRGFDRKWSLFCAIAFGVSVLAWLVYLANETGLINYLKKVGFDEDTGKQIAAFSIGQAGWFLLFFGAAIVLVVLILAGVFTGKRARLGGVLLGALLVADLGRANLPWIIHWNYKQKYDIDPNNSANSTNPVINFLRDKPYEHRVSDLQSQTLFEELYRIEWMQHHFPYYNVQCLDVIQSPRVTSDLQAYDISLSPFGNASYLVARRWQLSNTSYLLGPANYLDSVNQELDPVQHRFRIVQRFNIVPKPGVDVAQLQQEMQQGIFEGEKLTAVPDDNGEYALYEFTGALPRAKLYTDWQTNSTADLKNFTTNGLSDKDLMVFDNAGTNGFLTLKTLTSPTFNPEQTVLLDVPLSEANPGNMAKENSGTVEIKKYTPKDIVLSAQSPASAVLLLNDRYDSNWRVLVDDKPEQLLHCNYIMRGVFLPSGSHTVEFEFSLPHKPLYITLTAMGLVVLLCVYLFFATRKPSPAAKK